MKNKVMLLTFIVVAIFAFIINAQGENVSEKAPSETPETKNTQKVYGIYTDGISSSGNVLTDVSRVAYFGIESIKGKSVYSWTDGKTVYIPVQKIRSIIEFDSIDDYNTAMKKFKSSRYNY
jgi:hypothetical protein